MRTHTLTGADLGVTALQVYRAPVADCLAAMAGDVGRGGGGVSFGHPVPPHTQTSRASCYVTQLVGSCNCNCNCSCHCKCNRWWVAGVAAARAGACVCGRAPAPGQCCVRRG